MEIQDSVQKKYDKKTAPKERIFCVSGLCRKTAEPSGNQAVKEGDERSQTQRADQRADADDASEQRCCNGADGVGCDAAPEVGDFALAAAEDDRQRVVGRDARCRQSGTSTRRDSESERRAA